MYGTRTTRWPLELNKFIPAKFKIYKLEIDVKTFAVKF